MNQECIVVTNPMIAANGSVQVTLSKFLRVLSPHYARMTVLGGNVTVEPGIAGVEVISLPIRRANSRPRRIWDIFANQLRLARLIRKHAVKGIPVYFWIADKQLLPFWAAKAKKADVRYFLYGNMAKEGRPGRLQTLSAKLAAHMANRADSVCVESPGVAAEWQGFLKDPHIRVIHLYTQLDTPPGTTEKKTVIGMLCRLTEGKHVLESIRAFSQFHESHPEYTMEIIGSGKQEDACRDLIDRLAAQDCIRMSGWIDHAQLPSRTAHWKYLLFPTDTEGMPNSVLEMMGQGIPAIASPAGGIRDLIRHGENGWLLERADETAIAQALEAVLTQDEIYPSMAQAAKAAVENGYSLEAAQENAKHQI